MPRLHPIFYFQNLILKINMAAVSVKRSIATTKKDTLGFVLINLAGQISVSCSVLYETISVRFIAHLLLACKFSVSDTQIVNMSKGLQKMKWPECSAK